jgi:hypothetical protein
LSIRLQQWFRLIKMTTLIHHKKGSIIGAVLAVVTIVLAVAVIVYVLFLRYGASSVPDQPYKTPLGREGEQTSSVSIASCRPAPYVVETARGATIRFSNPDNRAHVLYFSRLFQVTIPAHGYKDIPMSFYLSPGAHHYDCDSSKQAGIISVFFEVSLH